MSEQWVPVEHRFLGLDRRTFRPALIALAVALVLAYGLPAVNAAIPWHNEIKAGQVLELGNGATAVPPVGWQLESGTLKGASPTSLQVDLATGGATIGLRGASFPGDAGAFLDQVLRSQGSSGVGAGRGTVTTDGGLVGVAQTSSSPSGDGLQVAFKMSNDVALLVRVRTAPGQFERYEDTVSALLRSVTPGAGK
ncbi:hypothetical protein [Lentzea sp. NPDC051838]|uniref:hypothetical protein n=1 Tax=Lentzea sp. NPDC051838 TaxID=3154849 RepID=UPI00341FDD78